MEAIGRYLCKMYYNGELKCSTAYEKNSAKFFIARCVEKPLEDANGRRGHLAEVWRKLMLGDLAKLTKGARSRVLGGRAFRDEQISIDGSSLCQYEILLYETVAEEFKKLLL